MSDTYRGATDLKGSLQHRAGGRPGIIEKARNPRQAMVRLVMYLKPFAPSISLVVGFIMLSSIIGLSGPYLMGVAIDRFIGGKDIPGLVRPCVMMLVAYLASNIFMVLANWIMARVSQHALRKLRSDLFAHIQTLTMEFFDTHAAGGLMSRLTNDIDAINQVVSQNVTSLVASTLTMAGILVAMFALNHWLALASPHRSADHGLVYQIRREIYQKGIPRPTEESRRAQWHCRGGDKRPEDHTGVQAQSIGDRVIQGQQPGCLQGRRLCELVRVAVDAACAGAGQILCRCAGRPWWLACVARARDGRYHRFIHQLWPELYIPAAAAGQSLQLDTGRTGRGRACLRDHRYSIGGERRGGAISRPCHSRAGPV